jgi:hypothetical protein
MPLYTCDLQLASNIMPCAYTVPLINYITSLLYQYNISIIQHLEFMRCSQKFILDTMSLPYIGWIPYPHFYISATPKVSQRWGNTIPTSCHPLVCQNTIIPEILLLLILDNTPIIMINLYAKTKTITTLTVWPKLELCQTHI